MNVPWTVGTSRHAPRSIGHCRGHLRRNDHDDCAAFAASSSTTATDGALISGPRPCHERARPAVGFDWGKLPCGEAFPRTRTRVAAADESVHENFVAGQEHFTRAEKTSAPSRELKRCQLHCGCLTKSAIGCLHYAESKAALAVKGLPRLLRCMNRAT